MLQKVSLIGVISVIYNLGVITVTMFTGFTAPEPNCIGDHCYYEAITKLEWSKVRLVGPGGWDGISLQAQGFASLIFSFVNHQLIFPLMYDLKNPTKKRMDKIFLRVHLTEVISYIVVGMAGYLLLVQHIPARDINPIVIASIPTLPVTIGKFLMAISLFFAVPLNLFPAK